MLSKKEKLALIGVLEMAIERDFEDLERNVMTIITKDFNSSNIKFLIRDCFKRENCGRLTVIRLIQEHFGLTLTEVMNAVNEFVQS